MNVDQISFESLRRINRAADLYSRALFREHNLTGPQLSFLRQVARHGEAPVGVLAKAAILGSPTVTGIVDRLEKQGLVSRVPSQEDRRKVLIAITPAGRRLLQRNPSLLNDGFRDQLSRLPKAEQRRICDVLQRVANMMEHAVAAVGGPENLSRAVQRGGHETQA